MLLNGLSPFMNNHSFMNGNSSNPLAAVAAAAAAAASGNGPNSLVFPMGPSQGQTNNQSASQASLINGYIFLHRVPVTICSFSFFLLTDTR